MRNHQYETRTVHAKYPDMEIVRYERAGKWFLEPTIPGLPRQHVTVLEAARSAVWGRNQSGGTIYFDRRGGQTFDRLVQKEGIPR